MTRDHLPDPTDSQELRYLAVRLSGMEADVELTPGYIAWREKQTREHKLLTDAEFRRSELSRRLGSQALGQE